MTWLAESRKRCPRARRAGGLLSVVVTIIALAACTGPYLAADGNTPCSPRVAASAAGWIGKNPSTCPPPTVGGLMAPMTIAGQPVVILFSGHNPGPDDNLSAQTSFNDDTWMWDGQSWTQLDPPQSPPPLSGASMAYDPAHNNIVLFGGALNGPLSARTYVFDGTTWTDRSDESDLRTFAHTPRARYDAMMSGDVADGGVVLFGGEADNTLFDDVWLWNGVSWIEKQPDSRGTCDPASRPCPRARGAMAPDPATNGVVLFGGDSPLAVKGDTWIWQGSSWTKQSPAHSPGARESAAFAQLDAQTDILFGGTPKGTGDDTWSWDGTDWTQVAQAPISRTGAQAAVLGDAPGRPAQLVVFGGSAHDFHARVGLSYGVKDTYDDTWVYTKSSPPTPSGPWLQLQAQGPASATRPDGRQGAGMAMFHSSSGHHNAVLFGGSSTSGSLLDDTWVWDGTSWNEILPSGLPEPGPRVYPSMAWDANTNTVVLFGGLGAGGHALSDTWIWDPQTFVWTEITPCGTPDCSPSGRMQGAMATDILDSGVLLFGGRDRTGVLDDTWTWSGLAHSWTHRVVAGPSGRAEGVAGMNPADAGVVLFGGTDDTSALDETWTWDGTAWTHRTPSSAPPGRIDPSMASLDTNTVLFGGSSLTGSLFDDTWEWDGRNWTQATGSAPPARAGAAAAGSETSASDPTLNMLLFGGSPASVDNDTWRFTP